MSNDSIVKELLNIQSHAALTQHWAGELIKKIEAEKVRKVRKPKGLTPEDIARIRANRMKTILKKRN